MQVLIAEDRAKAIPSHARALKRSGHEIRVVGTGADALATYPDAELVLLDLDLPDIDGLEVCRRIRTGSATPVIAFADRGAGLDRVLCLQAGADDCLEKPYELRELLARIDAVMRRSRSVVWSPRMSFSGGALCIDPAAREVHVHGKRVCLTRKEFDLLHYLARNADAVISRERLMAEIWDEPAAGALSPRASRTIDTHVGSLRGKLGHSGWIRTARGIGYRLGDD